MRNLASIITDEDNKNICHTCGTKYAEPLPGVCLICADDRQYVPATGQQWTSYHILNKKSSIRFSNLLPNVFDLRIVPAFAIAQKAHLICSPGGNVLWDCLPFIDEASVAFIRSIGGIRAIAISHPHYYSLMAVWAEVFDCPIYLHEADQEWIMDKSPRIQLWNGASHKLWDNMSLIHTAGHFAGSTVLHAPAVGDKGSLFVGDSLYVAHSLKFISMMHSYPNAIPLPERDILYISEQVNKLNFDGMYGAFEWQNVHTGAKELFVQSVKRYLEIFK